MPKCSGTGLPPTDIWHDSEDCPELCEGKCRDCGRYLPMTNGVVDAHDAK